MVASNLINILNLENGCDIITHLYKYASIKLQLFLLMLKFSHNTQCSNSGKHEICSDVMLILKVRHILLTSLVGSSKSSKVINNVSMEDNKHCIGRRMHRSR